MARLGLVLLVFNPWVAFHQLFTLRRIQIEDVSFLKM